jgi:hypothetical protein
VIGDQFNTGGCPDIVLKLLTSQKVGPTYYLAENEESILHFACYMGWTSVVKHLLGDEDVITSR